MWCCLIGWLVAECRRFIFRALLLFRWYSGLFSGRMFPGKYFFRAFISGFLSISLKCIFVHLKKIEIIEHYFQIC